MPCLYNFILERGENGTLCSLILIWNGLALKHSSSWFNLEQVESETNYYFSKIIYAPLSHVPK